ncbi:VOC family protein [Gilvimarinus agarilyticus]|uniref:VOC family protein n=1 Tax=Gilvimarinus agarilyticus TaxID=679259 RepID=UPI0005A1E7F6|nr:VOC family protein [Gilvimarinus agarilyticus]
MKKRWIGALAALTLTGCAQMQVDLPAVGESSSQRLPGKVIWHDLISAKPAASQAFYEQLFGWEFEAISIPTGMFSHASYHVISHEGRVIGGMVDQDDLKADSNLSQWVVVLASDNIEQSVASIRSAGGTVLGDIVDLNARGKMAVAKDKQGALFALLQTPDGDPADRTSIAAGDFLWNELWTTDVGDASNFYSDLMPYTEAEHPETGKQDYRVLKAHNHPRAGVMNMPVKQLDPTWVSYLRVTDAEALDNILARVEALGGAILLPAQDRLAGGRAALIAGPSGAGIALQTWPVNPEATP